MPHAILQDILGELDGVKPNGAGFVARCPAHTDKSPSLSVKAGYNGVLLRCWAGCDYQDVCEALGIEVHELFYEPREPKQHKPETSGHAKIRPYFWDWRDQCTKIEILLDDWEHKICQGLGDFQGMDLDHIVPRAFDCAMNAVSRGYQGLEKIEELREQLFEIQAYLRQKEEDVWTTANSCKK